MKHPPVQSVDRQPAAFTLVELLVVIAIIGVLASLLLPALSRAKSRAQSSVCLGHLRQLSLAFHMYLDDHQSTFPTAAAHSGLGAQPEDWVWWQTDSAPAGPVMRDAGQGRVIPYLSGYNPSLLRCPADGDADARELVWRNSPGTEQYFYSYSLNAHGDMGMASFISRDRIMILLNRITSVRNPSGKVMLAEEKGAVADGPGSAVIDDGRWVPPGYPLTSRHGGQANAAFADGRVELVPFDFANSSHPERYDPKL